MSRIADEAMQRGPSDREAKFWRAIADRDAEIARLESENKALRSVNKGDEEQIKRICDQNAALRDALIAEHQLAESESQRLNREITRLREALKFYANRETWRGDPCPLHSDVDGDFVATPGKCARAALEGKP